MIIYLINNLNQKSFSSSQADEKTVISLSAEQQDVFDWAVTHSFWHTATVSLETFKHVLDFPNGKLKAQYDAHKKAQHATKQTGLNSEIFVNKTGGNYETRKQFNQSQKLAPWQRVAQKCGFGEYESQQSANIYDSYVVN